MSICDEIVVMKEGLLQQMGQPQQVYDDPANHFVAAFLGTPPINQFAGRVEKGQLYIGGQTVLPVPGVLDQAVTVGIRPEGFVLNETGAFTCQLKAVEVMGRDITVLGAHEACLAPVIRAIITAESRVNTASSTVSFDLKPHKVLLFDRDGQRIRF